MNLPKITFSRPRFSSRFFIYLLFGLVLLALLVEGGYYFWVQRKEKARWQATDWVELIEGRINEIKGRTLIITVKDFNSLIPKKVEVEVANDAKIFTPLSRNLIEKLSSVSGREEQMELAVQLEAATQSFLFTDLKVGDIIQAGILTKLTERKFKAKSIALIKG